jgi:hypothetical protein
VIEPDPADDPVHGLGKAGQDEPVVAAGRGPGDAARLQHHDRPAAPRDLARGGQAGEAATDHADVNVEIEGERPAQGRSHHRRGVPGRRIVRLLGRVHVFFPSAISGRLSGISNQTSLSKQPTMDVPIEVHPDLAKSC